jgi:hypothetical protein
MCPHQPCNNENYINIAVEIPKSCNSAEYFNLNYFQEEHN